MALEIRYLDYVFDITKIVNKPNMYRTISLLSDSLAYDTFRFKVKSSAIGEQKLYTKFLEWVHTVDNKGYVIDAGDFSEFTYATPVYVYEDGVQKALFYVQDIEQTNEKDMHDEFFIVSCMSTIGVLSRVPHVGDVYVAEQAGDIIAEIMRDLPYTIDNDVASVLMSGWLPYVKDGRSNLQKVLFGLGASVLRNDDGTIRFAFNQPDVAKTIPKDRVFIAPTTEKKLRKSRIVVTEHSFIQSQYTASEVIYDNTNEGVVTATIQKFDEPYYDYAGEGGLTVIDSGANWAKVSGIGRLTAKKYLHSKRDIEQIIDENIEDDPLVINNQTLVSSANVNGVLQRFVNYYSNARTRNVVIKVEDEKAGDLVELPDRRGNMVTGYISDIDESASSFWKGNVNVVTNWTPITGGNDYNAFLIVKGSDLSNGTWNVPSALRGKKARVVLFSGAQGGAGGHYGKQGGSSSGSGWTRIGVYDDTYYQVGGKGNIPKGGEGGKGGKGGASASKLINIDIASLANSYPVSFGAGGAGGTGGTATFDPNGSRHIIVTEPTEGQRGGASTFDTYSTDLGATFEGTYVNIVTGEIIATVGDDGINGADGGDGGESESYRRFDTYADAQAFDYNTIPESHGKTGGNLQSYTGGAGAGGVSGTQIDNSYHFYDELSRGHYRLCSAGGGGGGGAAMGGNGSAGTVGKSRDREFHYSDYYVHYYYANECSENTYYSENPQYWFDCSFGGDGGNVTITPSKPLYKGGQGGHGGGGGGASGQSLGYQWINTTSHVFYYLGSASGGKGGNGGNGGQGSDGFMIVYYKED